MSSTMDSLLLAVRTDPRLRILASNLKPAHAADILAAAVLSVVAILYLFPKWTWNRPDPHEYIYFERPQSDSGAGGGGGTTKNIAKRLEELVRLTKPSPLPFY